ncbi:hypothetical protein [Streptomyces sp. NPDC017988]|uniref:hypothetical protein n=1 Tax=Streptomyces sp. NPDC017988 TaxID=3365025 RepID=UPI0037B1D351
MQTRPRVVGAERAGPRAPEGRFDGRLVSGPARWERDNCAGPRSAAAPAVLAPGAPGLLRKRPGAVVAASSTGAATAVLPDDLGERAMIGDAGAHALDAALGTAIVPGNGRAGLAAHAAAVVAAAVSGDRISPVAAGA